LQLHPSPDGPFFSFFAVENTKLQLFLTATNQLLAEFTEYGSKLIENAFRFEFWEINRKIEVEINKLLAKEGSNTYTQ
jgi:hypothetical protein